MQFSIEFYPAMDDKSHNRLKETIELYRAEVHPKFVSLTHGAGGEVPDRDRDRRALETIEYMRRCGLEVAAHLPHGGRSRKKSIELFQSFCAAGAQMIVALRGDPPDQTDYTPHSEGFEHTADFVAAIKTLNPDMPVYVAGYPEKHPESVTEEADLENLKRKVTAGATGVLGQFCFNATLFAQWKAKCHERDIKVPVIPGIIALLNYQRVCERAARCGTRISPNIHAAFHGLSQGSEDYNGRVRAVMEGQIDDLAQVGMDHVHVYALNSPKFVPLLARLGK